MFVDISSHGLGHLAQASPILNELSRLLPGLRLTVRSGLTSESLRARLSSNFTHISQQSDFGFAMRDAVRIDYAMTAAAYRDQHANWLQRVVGEANFLSRLRPDLVITDVAYLPLAGAERAGIPSLSMCSLNWADLFLHVFGSEPWSAPIYREMLAAYNSAECFLRLTPAMPMPDLLRTCTIAPVAALGKDRRAELNSRLTCFPNEKLVLIAFGGFEKDLKADLWPRTKGVRWLIPENWPVVRDDMIALEPLGFPFTDLLRSVDAIITKPGYGTFTEAACNGTPVLYLRRENWPEQECLIDWLRTNARCCEIDEARLVSGQIGTVLEVLWQQELPSIPVPCGASEVANFIAKRLCSSVPP